MCAIKNAIIDGNYPVSKKLYVHSTLPSDKYLIENLTATVDKFNQERKNKDLDEDLSDNWYENNLPHVDYSGTGGY